MSSLSSRDREQSYDAAPSERRWRWLLVRFLFELYRWEQDCRNAVASDIARIPMKVLKRDGTPSEADVLVDLLRCAELK